MTTDSGAGAPAPDPMAALVDIRNQVIRLGQEVAAMRAEPASASDGTANAVTAELREAVRFLAERLDGVARMVAQRGEELADTRGALGAIDAHVRSQAETIGVLTTGMQALPSYGQQVSAVQDSLNGLQQRLGGIETSLGQRLGGIEQALARPTDAGVSDRLSAIEGMLGPLAQRLAQAHTDHAASLQALHGKLESLAAGTQAALAQPAVIDESALAGLEPRLAQLAGEIQSLRSDVGAVVTARAGSAGSGAPVDLSPLAMQLTQLSGEMDSLRSDVAAVVAVRGGSEGSAAPVDLSPVHEQLSKLSEQVAAVAAAASAGGGSSDGPAPAAVDLAPVHEQLSQLSQQVAAVAAAPRADGGGGAALSGDAEARIMAHVDDAVFALAQTLLGRGVAGPLIDLPATPVARDPAPAAATSVDVEDAYDETDVDESHDGVHDDAQIDFSQADLGDEDADTESWQRPHDHDHDHDGHDHDGHDHDHDGHDEEPAWADQSTFAGGPRGSAPVPGVDAPFDQEAAWGPPPLPVPPEGPATVVPERRRRWFSW